MKIEIMIAVLGIICIGALAAAFVLWAKIDEQKQKTKDEHDNYIAALQIGKTNAEYAQRLEKELEQSKARDCQGHIDFLNFCVDTLEKKNAVLQDRLSSLLCPHNDHVWKDGVCAKCGRVQDAEIH